MRAGSMRAAAAATGFAQGKAGEGSLPQGWVSYAGAPEEEGSLVDGTEDAHIQMQLACAGVTEDQAMRVVGAALTALRDGTLDTALATEGLRRYGDVQTVGGGQFGDTQVEPTEFIAFEIIQFWVTTV